MPLPNQRYQRRAGTGPAFWGLGGLYTFLATGDETNGAYFQFEALEAPGSGPPPHIHHREEETLYIVEGSIEVYVGGEIMTAAAGDFVRIPKGIVHWFKSVGSQTAKMLVTFVPAGFEKFFEEVLDPAEDRTAAPPPLSEKMIRKMVAAASKHGLEILPPAEPGRS